MLNRSVSGVGFPCGVVVRSLSPWRRGPREGSEGPLRSVGLQQISAIVTEGACALLGRGVCGEVARGILTLV
eukprot:14200073-Alexandrium_andersonii.AAC.1